VDRHIKERPCPCMGCTCAISGAAPQSVAHRATVRAWRCTPRNPAPSGFRGADALGHAVAKPGARRTFYGAGRDRTICFRAAGGTPADRPRSDPRCNATLLSAYSPRTGMPDRRSIGSAAGRRDRGWGHTNGTAGFSLDIWSPANSPHHHLGSCTLCIGWPAGRCPTTPCEGSSLRLPRSYQSQGVHTRGATRGIHDLRPHLRGFASLEQWPGTIALRSPGNLVALSTYLGHAHVYPTPIGTCRPRRS